MEVSHSEICIENFERFNFKNCSFQKIEFWSAAILPPLKISFQVSKNISFYLCNWQIIPVKTIHYKYIKFAGHHLKIHTLLIFIIQVKNSFKIHKINLAILKLLSERKWCDWYIIGIVMCTDSCVTATAYHRQHEHLFTSACCCRSEKLSWCLVTFCSVEENKHVTVWACKSQPCCEHELHLVIF